MKYQKCPVCSEGFVYINNGDVSCTSTSCNFPAGASSESFKSIQSALAEPQLPKDHGQATIKGGIVYKVERFNYVLAGRTIAEIEVLHLEGKFTSQARMQGSDDVFTCVNPLLFTSIEDALDAIIVLIEHKIQDDPWVQQVKNISEVIYRK